MRWPQLRAALKQTPYHTEVTMIAPRPGDRVIVLGAADPGLAAALAHVTGLNGQLIVMDDAPHAAGRVERAAAQAGELVEFQAAPLTALPAGADSTDIVVLVRRLGTMSDADRQGVTTEVLRALRPAGRLIVIEGGAGGGFLKMLRKAPPSLGADGIRAALAAGGWKASREIGEVDGAIYVEAVKPRS